MRLGRRKALGNSEKDIITLASLHLVCVTQLGGREKYKGERMNLERKVKCFPLAFFYLVHIEMDEGKLTGGIDQIVLLSILYGD